MRSTFRSVARLKGEIQMLRRQRSRAFTVVIPAAAALLLSLGPTAAQSVANFYAGKTVTLSIGFTAGGGYDLYARAIAR